jgi:outer membrane lipoprotein SlyB
LQRYAKLLIGAILLAALAGCGRTYSPDTYSSAAAQQANKVVQGVVAGVRPVAISADGTVGAVTGGAAGGVLGAQTPGSPVVTALGTIGGSMVGGLLGTSIEHAAGDTTAFEYIVRKSDGELLSVTQKDAKPLEIGQKVLLIFGNQARIVPDYSVPGEPPAAAAARQEKATETPAASAAPADAPAPSAPSAAPSPTATASPDAAPPAAAAPAEENPAAGQIPTSPPLALHPPSAPAGDGDHPPAEDPATAAPAAKAPDDAPAPTESEAAPSH